MKRATNVIELNEVRNKLKQQGALRMRNDKREHSRLESQDRLFVQVVLSAADPDLVGTTLSCESINLSVAGIQFRTDTPVPHGSLLDLWIDIKTRPGKFFLAGEVRWSRPAGEFDDTGREYWYLGVQLKTGAATDILEWRDFHAQASGQC